MWTWISILIFIVTLVEVGECQARRTYITAEQRAQLEKIQTVYVNVLALTENGKVSADELLPVVKSRMEELGFTVVTDSKQPHDVQFKVKCEERKRWAGTTRSGGDAELADAPARLWKGPACLFSYLLNGKDLGWYKEVRTDFEDADQAALSAKADNAGAYAMKHLKAKLQDFDFPVMAATEWDQPQRFLPLLKDPSTSEARKVRILDILTKHKAENAFAYLKDLIQDEKLADKAIVAYAGAGSIAIPILSDMLKNGSHSRIKAAAAKGLGVVAATTGDPATNQPLLEYLTNALKTMNTSQDIDFPVLTEVVWAMTKLRNEKYLKPIEELNRKIWTIRDTSTEMEKLREAANVATKMIDLDYQIM